jgi:hypothetical protein
MNRSAGLDARTRMLRNAGAVVRGAWLGPIQWPKPRPAAALGRQLT